MTLFKRNSSHVYVLLTHSILCRLTHCRKHCPGEGGLSGCLKMWDDKENGRHLQPYTSTGHHPLTSNIGLSQLNHGAVMAS